MSKYKVYSDGAAKGNPGNAAWAYIIVKDDDIITGEFSGYEDCATNNRMELLGPLGFIRTMRPKMDMEIVSDSKYVVNAINDWRKNWFKYDNSMQSPEDLLLSKRDLKNADIFREIHFLVCKNHLNVKMTWVKGHSGHKWNERCDELCNLAIKNKKSLT